MSELYPADMMGSYGQSRDCLQFLKLFFYAGELFYLPVCQVLTHTTQR